MRMGTRWMLSLMAAIAMVSASPGTAFGRSADYKLGYGDALSVTVVGQPNLSVEAQPVRPDGRISLPLVQQVQIQGRTVEEVTAALTRAYKPYLQNPQIVVNVAHFRALKVTVLGQVAKPGTYTFDELPTLVDAVATAGGLTDRAQRGAITVVAPGGKRQTYDLDRLLTTAGPMPRLSEGSVVEIQEVWGPDWYRIIPITASILTAGALLWRYGLDSKP